MSVLFNIQWKTFNGLSSVDHHFPQVFPMLKAPNGSTGAESPELAIHVACLPAELVELT